MHIFDARFPLAAGAKPNDAVLFDWAPDQATRERILAGNPAALYGFTAA